MDPVRFTRNDAFTTTHVALASVNHPRHPTHRSHIYTSKHKPINLSLFYNQNPSQNLHQFNSQSVLIMGNCCLKGSRSSTMVWAESADENDHWVYYSDPNLQQKQSLLSYERSENRSEPSVQVNELSNNNNNWKNREVKIMLSKKKLGELLGKMKMEDLHKHPCESTLGSIN
ncbi:hypothetical protein R6Q57_024261 [Mikania cordata]